MGLAPLAASRGPPFVFFSAQPMGLTETWLMDEGGIYTAPDPISNSTLRRFDGCTVTRVYVCFLLLLRWIML